MQTTTQRETMQVGDFRGTPVPLANTPLEHKNACFKFVRASDRKELFISQAYGTYVVTSGNDGLRELTHRQVEKLLSLSKNDIAAGEAEIERENNPGFMKSAVGAVAGVGAMSIAVAAAGGLLFAAFKGREIYYKAFVVDPIVERISQQEHSKGAHESTPVAAVPRGTINLSNFLNQPIQLSGSMVHRVNVFEGTNAGSYYSLSSKALSGDALVLVPLNTGQTASTVTGKEISITGRPVLIDGQVVLRADSIQ